MRQLSGYRLRSPHVERAPGIRMEVHVNGPYEEAPALGRKVQALKFAGFIAISSKV